ncbi:hypothetical protein MKW92_051724 [Papaver armeniacum]|nr:hypothetical protein MKW92_051724 [Papaver armeniacum]
MVHIGRELESVIRAMEKLGKEVAARNEVGKVLVCLVQFSRLPWFRCAARNLHLLLCGIEDEIIRDNNKLIISKTYTTVEIAIF